MKVAELELDGSPALAALHKLSEGIEHFEHKLKSAGAAFAGFGIAFETVKEIAERFEGVLSLAGQMNSLHFATGESVHDLVVLSHAMKLAGAGAEGAQGFIFKLNQAISGVNEEGKSTATALQALGLSQEDLVGKSSLEKLELLSKGFAKVSSEEDKAAIAGDLFGKRTGANALRLIANPEALETAKRQAEPLAALLDKNAEKFEELEHAIAGVGMHVNEFFAGALEGVSGGATDLAHALDDINFVEIGKDAGEIANAFLQIAKALEPLVPLVGKLAHGFHDLMDSGAGKGAVIGAGLGTLIGPEGTLLGGILGGAAGLLFGGGNEAEKHHGLSAHPFGDGGLQGFAKDTPVSALQRIGRGGGFGGSGDPLLTEAQRQTAILSNIERKLSPVTASAGLPGLDTPPV